MLILCCRSHASGSSVVIKGSQAKPSLTWSEAYMIYERLGWVWMMRQVGLGWAGSRDRSCLTSYHTKPKRSKPMNAQQPRVKVRTIALFVFVHLTASSLRLCRWRRQCGHVCLLAGAGACWALACLFSGRVITWDSIRRETTCTPPPWQKDSIIGKYVPLGLHVLNVP